MPRVPKKLLFYVLAAPLAAAAVPALTRLSLPDAKGGIGFDDILFSPTLNLVLVPSGEPGCSTSSTRRRSPSTPSAASARSGPSSAAGTVRAQPLPTSDKDFSLPPTEL